MMGILGVLLAIVMVGVISVGTFEYFHNASDTNHITNTQETIEQIASGIDKLYVGSHDYTNLTTDVATAAGLVPKAFLSGTSIVTPWNSKGSPSLITIAPADGDNSQFTISISGLPKKDCTNLGSAFLNTDGVSVSANGSAATDGSTLATGCAQTDPGTLGVTFS